MNWLFRTLWAPVGRKLMMALTGFCFIGFLIVHLAGNLTIYGGKDLFTSYVNHLHALGPLITIAEWGLLFLALVHVITGLTLFYENWKARPEKYVVSKRAGGRTIGSATMPYTGVLILIFVIWHLLTFHFVSKENTTTYQIVTAAFANPFYVFIYIAMMIVVAFHVSHGFWSLFQTIGANHPKYMPVIQAIGLCVSIIFGVGFGLIPVYISFAVV